MGRHDHRGGLQAGAAMIDSRDEKAGALHLDGFAHLLVQVAGQHFAENDLRLAIMKAPTACKCKRIEFVGIRLPAEDDGVDLRREVYDVVHHWFRPVEYRYSGGGT